MLKVEIEKKNLSKHFINGIRIMTLATCIIYLLISKPYRLHFKFKYYSLQEPNPICNYLKYAISNRELLCNDQSPGIYFNCAKESTEH